MLSIMFQLGVSVYTTTVHDHPKIILGHYSISFNLAAAAVDFKLLRLYLKTACVTTMKLIKLIDRAKLNRRLNIINNNILSNRVYRNGPLNPF